MEKEIELFSTKDLPLAASFVSLGLPVERIDYQIEVEKQRLTGYFGFEKTEELLKIEKDFLNGKLLIEPKTLFSNAKGLKSQVENRYSAPNQFFDKKNK